jgi:ornithine cyclodeaminase
MECLSETDVATLVDRDLALEAVEAVFMAMDAGEADAFPVVREPIGYQEALYGFKSGFDRNAMTLGVKVGGYWPHNGDRGLASHQSTVLLVAPETGQCNALVAGNHLTALRTAAAAATSIRHLAPAGARVLGILGAGHQASWQLEAALDIGAFTEVLAWNRRPERTQALEAIAEQRGCSFRPVSLPELGEASDVIITITSSFAPLLKDVHVVGPTHIAAMGTDTEGKQELDPVLVARARCFAELPSQSARLGECQHAVGEGLMAESEITSLGGVIAERVPGRRGSELTLFDGSGVGLQDLSLARAALERARVCGIGKRLDLTPE